MTADDFRQSPGQAETIAFLREHGMEGQAGDIASIRFAQRILEAAGWQAQKKAAEPKPRRPGVSRSVS